MCFVRDHLQVQEDLHSEVVRIYRAILPSHLPPQGCPEIWSLLDPEPLKGTLARSQSNQQWPEPDLQDAAPQNLDCTLESGTDRSWGLRALSDFRANQHWAYSLRRLHPTHPSANTDTIRITRSMSQRKGASNRLHDRVTFASAGPFT